MKVTFTFSSKDSLLKAQKALEQFSNTGTVESFIMQDDAIVFNEIANDGYIIAKILKHEGLADEMKVTVDETEDELQLDENNTARIIFHTHDDLLSAQKALDTYSKNKRFAQYTIKGNEILFTKAHIAQFGSKILSILYKIGLDTNNYTLKL